jgi:hypothetical protein
VALLAPAAYSVIPNTVQLDQATLYVERVPDTVQTDHFDWGFRLTNLYGLDYRFTAAKGYFSNQLLGKTNPDGSVGNKYGYDPVMFYVDLYDPHVAQGMNIRIGRYISLPDIEAQLAPNNYYYSHSLTYTYDCYTQTGVNATIRLNDHWMVQGGVSPGCEAAPWIADAKLTFNWCVGVTWRKGSDNLYVCDNAINDGNYAYNNLQAYYATWYHKFNDKWHMATEVLEEGLPLDTQRVLQRHRGPEDRRPVKIHRARALLESLDWIDRVVPSGTEIRARVHSTRVQRGNQERSIHDAPVHGDGA